MLNAPFMVIWGHRKAGVQMKPRSVKKMPGSKRDGSLAQVKDEEKNISSQATDPQRHATVPQLMGRALKEQQICPSKVLKF